MREKQHPTPAELSAIVAEKLMGWTEVEFSPLPERVSQIKHWHGKHPDALDGEPHDRLPMYAAEMRWSWLVVEMMVEKGYRFTLRTVLDGWDATFINPSTNESYRMEWQTAPGAIARAALQTLG